MQDWNTVYMFIALYRFQRVHPQSPPTMEKISKQKRYGTVQRLTSVLGGGEWSASRFVRFNSEDTVTCTRWI